MTLKTAYIDCSPSGKAIIDAQELIQRIPELHIHVGDPNPDQLEQLLVGSTAIMNGHTPMDEALLSRHPTLRTIVFLGTGASSYIDVEAAKRLNINIHTIKGYGNRTNAEHAFALMLAASRDIANMDRMLRKGVWASSVGMELAGKRLGVIGAGGVGQTLIGMAAAFGMDVVAWNRSAIDPALPCRQLALDELLSTSDIVSLHLALNDETREIIGEQALARMKKTAIFVNVARGGLVDEKALIRALNERRIHHAALDVFDQEPLPADHAFTRMDNVTLTAHSAFNSTEAMTQLLKDGFDLLAASK